MEGKRKFLVVDDDRIDSYIIERVIKGYDPSVEVLVFNQPEKALAYLQGESACAESQALTLLLDINMPRMDGWQFLKAFEDLPERTKASCRLYMLSSSVLSDDKLKAESCHNVRGYINKPLKGVYLKAIFTQDNYGFEDHLPV